MIVFFLIVYVAVSGLVAILVVKLAKFQFPGNFVGAFLVALLSATIGGIIYTVFEDFFTEVLTRLFDTINLYPPLFSALIVVFGIAFIVNRQAR